MGIAKCSKLAAVASSFGQRFVGVKCWGELFHTSLVRKFMACLLITLWFRNRPAMGMKRTLGSSSGASCRGCTGQSCPDGENVAPALLRQRLGLGVIELLA